MIKTNYILGLVMAIALASCDTESEINIDNYVVNSFISSDTPFIVKTTKTVSVFDTATYSPLKNLEGKLYENGELIGDLIYQLPYQREGIPEEVPEGYSITGFVPEQGKEYSFELRDGNFVIQGSDVIPYAVNFTVDTTTVLDDYDLSTLGTECTLNFTDPADRDNYYVIAYNATEFFSNEDTIGWTQAIGWMKSDDPAIEHSFYYQGLLYTGNRFIFSDKYFNGKEYSMPVRIFAGQNSGRRVNLTIYLLSVSEQYYKYVTSSIKQQENNEDYYAEPTQVYNNIENGFGIFAGFSVSKQIVEFGNE
ncbi:MAG: DUF4249 domain-containing protein [Bacteroidales bacterium]|nr:DUF4249 domain-containing protein [Bacteroidales bacterium]